MVLETVLVTISAASMAGVLVIGALVVKARKDKMIKAASPPLLYLMLFGAFVLYSEVLIGWLPAGRVTCMARPWIRHVGFSITYGALLIKTWRISAIMRMVKTKVLPTKDSELFRAVAIIILISGSYMIVWTLADPLQPLPLAQQPEAEADDVTQAMSTSNIFICISPWWDFIISAGEFCFLVWGATLCYQARKAPDIYNETRSISYSLWNEALWVPFYIYASCLLSINPNIHMNLLLCFLRVQCTVTVTLLLLFVPKFRVVFSTLRELRGTVADVYGAKRVHRLSLMITKHGTVKSIYCVPCGPLTYLEGIEEDTMDSVSEAGDTNKENHYTKAEVDALIEMVSRLKNEKSLYKTQVRRLYHLLKEYKHRLPINSLPVYLVAETPERDDLSNPDLVPQVDELPVSDSPSDYPAASSNAWHDFSSTSAYSSSRTLPNESPDPKVEGHPASTRMGCDPDLSRLAEADYGCGMTSQSRKASTVTTYLSNASDDNNSSDGDCVDGAEDDLLRYGKSPAIDGPSAPNCLTSPVSDYSSFQESLPIDSDDMATPCAPEQANSKITPFLDLARNEPPPEHCQRENPDDSWEDYPRIVETNVARSDPDSSQDIQDFISTICGSVKGRSAKRVENDNNGRHADGGGQAALTKCHELDTLSNGKASNILSNAVKLSTKAFDRRRKGSRKASDKMSFVMYI